MTEELTFALDIGTRTIIGLLMKEKETGYEIIASAVREHETRAMLDGQIHNVQEVAREVENVKNEIEEKTETNLKKVAIAAAGRALKTVKENYSYQLDKKRYIEVNDVEQLELMAIQKAQSSLADFDSEDKFDYHFIGYSTGKYFLDGMEIGELIGQRGKEIKVELVATFLPRIVIDSLLSVIDKVGLEVEHLTLEPIAASQVVIPESMSSFNLALVDIGAGTSDIAVTKEGSIIGYDMVPIAGDEITEIISENLLIDYNTAEKVKCSLQKEETTMVKTILGEEIEVDSKEVISVIEPQLNTLAESIAESILKINSNPPQAVIFIGGGSLTPDLKEKFSEKINLIPNRIGVRKKEDLENISGDIDAINTTQTLTPIGIAVTTKETQSKAIFIDVEVNNEMVNLLTISNPTTADALLAADIDIEKLNPSVGMGLTCTINGELKTIKGELGEKGSILLNGKEVDLNTNISSGDQITFKYAKQGKDGEALIEELIPDKDLVSYDIYLNGSRNKVKTEIFQNGKLVTKDTQIKDSAKIEYEVPKTIRDGVSQILEISADQLKNKSFTFHFNNEKRELFDSPYLIKENGAIVDLDRPLEENLKLSISKLDDDGLTIKELLKSQGANEIEITFNGSDLKIPNKLWNIEVNGEQKDLDYTIKENDKINVKSKRLTVDGIFNQINYNISDKMKNNLDIKINEKEANLNSNIKNGDNLNIELNR